MRQVSTYVQQNVFSGSGNDDNVQVFVRGPHSCRQILVVQPQEPPPPPLPTRRTRRSQVFRDLSFELIDALGGFSNAAQLANGGWSFRRACDVLPRGEQIVLFNRIEPEDVLQGQLGVRSRLHA